MLKLLKTLFKMENQKQPHSHGKTLDNSTDKLNPIWHELFLNCQLWEEPHHNFIVVAAMVMKFSTGVKLDVFYTMLTKEFVTLLLFRYYDVITCILADEKA